MAIGFTPKYIQDLPLDNVPPERFLIIALEAAQDLGWQFSHVSDAGFIAHTAAGMFKWNAEVTVRITGENANIKSVSTGSEMMDLGKNKKAILKFLTAFEEQKNMLTPEELETKYEALRQNFPHPAEDVLKLPPPTAGQRFSDFLSVFRPVDGYFITPLLIVSNLLVFIIMAICGVGIFEPDSQSLIRWGANFKPMTLAGEWWRLITCCFVHIGIVHLLLNMYALMYIGVLLEPRLGKLRFLTVYLLTGIVSGLTSLWWHDLNVSAGASGAVFGLYGVFLAMLTTNLIEKSARKPLLASIGIFVFYNLVYGMKGGIDNAAHIGGLVSGLLMGYTLYPGLKNPGTGRMQFAMTGLIAAVVLALSFVAYRNIPNDIGIYDAKMEVFSANETAALNAYKLAEHAGEDETGKAFQDNLGYWDKNLALLDEMDRLRVPDELRVQNRMLRQYCVARRKTYALIGKAATEHSDQYRAEIDEANKDVEQILAALNGKKDE